MSTSRIPEVFLSEIFGELRIIMEDNKFSSAPWMFARRWAIPT